MSRTNKDKPDWVQAEYYEPLHRCGWIRRSKYREVQRQLSFGFTYTDWIHVGYRWEYLGDCNLPAVPTRQHPQRWTWRSTEQQPRCYWKPEWLWSSWSQLRGTRKTAYCRAYFHKPQRNKVRAAARRVVQGDWETEFPDGRGRHSVYWDMN